MARLLSQPFAGVGVADRSCEEAEGQRQHKDIKHGVLLRGPSRVFSGGEVALGA